MEPLNKLTVTPDEVNNLAIDDPRLGVLIADVMGFTTETDYIDMSTYLVSPDPFGWTAQIEGVPCATLWDFRSFFDFTTNGVSEDELKAWIFTTFNFAFLLQGIKGTYYYEDDLQYERGIKLAESANSAEATARAAILLYIARRDVTEQWIESFDVTDDIPTEVVEVAENEERRDSAETPTS